MKKIIFLFLIIINSITFTFAEINISGTLGGVPIGYSNKGQINIGANAGSLGGGGGPLISLIALAQSVVQRLGILAIGVALIAFFWFLIVFISKGNESPEKRQEGIKGMGYAVLALFVMVSIWGIIGLMGSIVGTGVGGGAPSLEMPVMK